MSEIKKSNQSTVLVPGQQAVKRVKGGADGAVTQMIVMSPALAIVVRAMTQDSLLDNDWKVRQAAAN